MKGISAVIAVVLILMITVALAAAAYVWFGDIFEGITSGVGQAAEGVEEKITTDFDIENAVFSDGKGTNGAPPYGNMSITLRNLGTSDIALDNLAAYTSGSAANITEGVTGVTLGASDVVTITIENTTSACDVSLKITAGTGLDKIETVSCP